MILYYSPGAVSLAVHVLLRELGRSFELRRVPTGDDAHKAPDYLAVNPVGRIPALEVDGQVLTETPAILSFLARGTAWLPEGGWERARCDEILSRVASLAHPPFRMVVRPDRIIEPAAGEDALAAVRAGGFRDFRAALGHLEAALTDEGWAVGTTGPTVADVSLAVMGNWARFVRIPAEEIPGITRLSGSILGRPAAQAAIRAEGLVDDAGRPTPPTRV